MPRTHNLFARQRERLLGVEAMRAFHQPGDFVNGTLVGCPGLLEQPAAREDLGAGEIDGSGLDRVTVLGRALEHLHGRTAKHQLRGEQQAYRARSHHDHIHHSARVRSFAQSPECLLINDK